MDKLIGSLAALLTMFAFIPQILKVFRTKSCKDVSPITLGQLSLGVFLWIIYGLLRKDAVIVTANAITLLSLLILSSLYCIYKKRARP